MFLTRLLTAPISHHRRLINTSSLSFLKRVSSMPLSPPVSKFEMDPLSIEKRVRMLIGLCNLDAATEQARLAVLAEGEADATARICMTVLNALCDDRRYSDVYDLFHDLTAKSNSDYVSHMCHYPIVTALCGEGKLDEALKFYRPLRKSRHASYFHSDLAQALVDAGRIDEAMDLFYCVSHSVYGMFIRGFLDMGNLQRANQLYQDLKLIGKDSVVEVSGAFMEHWFKQGMDEKAMECYMSCKEQHSKMGATAGNTLLKVFLKHGKETEAWSFFNQMLEENPKCQLYNTRFDSESCSIMVNECFRLGRVSEAIQIFDKVVGRITDPRLCFRNMITRFCEQGMLSEAERYFAQMCSQNFLVPDVPTYRVMRDAYVKADRVSDARRITNQTLDASLAYIGTIGLM